MHKHHDWHESTIDVRFLHSFMALDLTLPPVVAWWNTQSDEHALLPLSGCRDRGTAGSSSVLDSACDQRRKNLGLECAREVLSC